MQAAAHLVGGDVGAAEGVVAGQPALGIGQSGERASEIPGGKVRHPLPGVAFIGAQEALGHFRAVQHRQVHAAVADVQAGLGQRGVVPIDDGDNVATAREGVAGPVVAVDEAGRSRAEPGDPRPEGRENGGAERMRQHHVIMRAMLKAIRKEVTRRGEEREIGCVERRLVNAH